jgi:hypothetical protein
VRELELARMPTAVRPKPAAQPQRKLELAMLPATAKMPAKQTQLSRTMAQALRLPSR